MMPSTAMTTAPIAIHSLGTADRMSSGTESHAVGMAPEMVMHHTENHLHESFQSGISFMIYPFQTDLRGL